MSGKTSTHWVECWRDHPECAKDRIEEMAFTLERIQRWATFASGNVPTGPLLGPERIADLCKRTLAMVRENANA